MPNVENGFRRPRKNRDNAIFIQSENVPELIEYSIAAGGANVCEVTLTIQDGHGGAIEKPVMLNLWLSDDSAGEGLTVAAASGTVQAKSGEGTDVGELTAKKALVIQTKSDGTYTLEITDTAKTGYYIGVQLPFSGLNSISRQLETADYGA